MQQEQTNPSPRRKFIGHLATGAAALGLAGLTSPLGVHAGTVSTFSEPNSTFSDADEWFNKVKGKHRIVFDVTAPGKGHELILPFAWPKVFLLTNAATGTPEKDNGVVVILRHNAIPFAMENSLWTKYKFGEFFKIQDPANGKDALRNMFWKPNPVFSVPGIGPVPIGINELQESGVMFCVCDMAMTVNSAVIAAQMNLKAEDVKKDFLSGLLPGIQVVPSGVWAVGRAQEHQCAYCAIV